MKAMPPESSRAATSVTQREAGEDADPAAEAAEPARNRRARGLAHPPVVRRRADAMFPARLADLLVHLDFIEGAGYLRFAESGFLYVETPSGGILYFRVVQVFKGTSVRLSRELQT